MIPIWKPKTSSSDKKPAAATTGMRLIVSLQGQGGLLLGSLIHVLSSTSSSSTSNATVPPDSTRNRLLPPSPPPTSPSSTNPHLTPACPVEDPSAESGSLPRPTQLLSPISRRIISSSTGLDDEQIVVLYSNSFSSMGRGWV
ncbi:hypothetical protein ACLB2K_016921 [Fragaria x ananassa]